MRQNKACRSDVADDKGSRAGMDNGRKGGCFDGEIQNKYYLLEMGRILPKFGEINARNKHSI